MIWKGLNRSRGLSPRFPPEKQLKVPSRIFIGIPSLVIRRPWVVPPSGSDPVHVLFSRIFPR